MLIKLRMGIHWLPVAIVIVHRNPTSFHLKNRLCLWVLDFETYPTWSICRYLLVQLRRYYVDEKWCPAKLDCKATAGCGDSYRSRNQQRYLSGLETNQWRPLANLLMSKFHDLWERFVWFVGLLVRLKKSWCVVPGGLSATWSYSDMMFFGLFWAACVLAKLYLSLRMESGWRIGACVSLTFVEFLYSIVSDSASNQGCRLMIDDQWVCFLCAGVRNVNVFCLWPGLLNLLGRVLWLQSLPELPGVRIGQARLSFHWWIVLSQVGCAPSCTSKPAFRPPGLMSGMHSQNNGD